MCDTPEVDAKIQAFLAVIRVNNEAEVLANLRALRNLCARGAHVQATIAHHDELQQLLHGMLLANTRDASTQLPDNVLLTAWQLLANAIVNNENTQSAIWQRHGAAILEQCAKPPIGPHTDIQLMILYNIFKGGGGLLGEQKALESVINVWHTMVQEKCDLNLDFLHFIYEHFVVHEGRNTVRCYAHLKSEERTTFLDYVATYVRHHSPNGRVNTFLLHYLAKEFKIKSDCILRQTGRDEVAKVQPREAYALLKVIAGVSGSEMYHAVYAADHSLFLNVSSVLRCLVAVGKETQKSIFTPLNKLEEVALGSDASRDYESEISYELKTLLVRCVANLLYKNPTNQQYCADTQLMPALFECTNMDARNPLMKEWSILAIRNACIGSATNQATIANLTKQGDAKNDLLSELNLEMGALRIASNGD